MPGTSQTTAPLVFLPIAGNRICAFLFLMVGPTVLIGSLTYVVLAGRAGAPGAMALLICVVPWLLALMAAVFLISVRAELSATQVRRVTAFGERTLQISDVTSALMVTGNRGSRVLLIRTPNAVIGLTNGSFSNAQLKEMQESVRLRAADMGRQIQTTMPSPTPRQVLPVIGVYLGILFATIALVAVSGILHRR